MNCTNASEPGCLAAAVDYEQQQYDGSTDKLEIVIYSLCFVLGGPLNVLSLFRSLRAFRQHKAKSQILLLRISLNVADLITLFVFVPRQVIWMLAFQWYGGELLCRVCAFFSTFSFYANSFVIACIAIDRVFGAYNISSLNAHRKAYIRCRMLLSFGWAAAFVLSLPQVLIFTVARPYGFGDEFTQCAAIWVVAYHEIQNNILPSDARTAWKQLEMTYNVVHLLFIFWIPCTIIIGSYLTVLLILQGHLRQGPSNTSCFRRRIWLGSKDDSHTPTPPRSSFLVQADESYVQKVLPGKEDMVSFTDSLSNPCRTSSLRGKPIAQAPRIGACAVSTIHKAKQHAKKQAALIIIAYLAFWSPYNVLTVVNNYVFDPYDSPIGRIRFSFLNAVICANSIVNPIIYGVFRGIRK